MKLNTVYVNASHNRYEPKSSQYEFDNSLKNEYGNYLGCPTKKTNYIDKYYPNFLKGVRLIKYRVFINN
jgi:hypothetical protein